MIDFYIGVGSTINFTDQPAFTNDRKRRFANHYVGAVASKGNKLLIIQKILPDT